MTSRLRTGLAWAVVAAAALLMGTACGSDDEKKVPPTSWAGGNGGGGAGQDAGPDGTSLGGASGEAGMAGEAGTSGGGGNAGDTDAGEDAALDGADDASSEEAAAPTPCQTDVAFWAVGMAFKYPTSQALATALNALTYDPALHPITLALKAGKAPVVGKGALSATEDDGAYAQVFPTGKIPETIDITLENEAFASVGKQNVGYLRLQDENGPVFLELTAIEFSASTQSSCSIASVAFNARIPSSQSNVSLKIGGQTKTLVEIAGPPGDAGSDGWALSATFQGESIKFDFTKFPVD